MIKSGDRVVVESGSRSGESGIVKYASDEFCYVVVNVQVVSETYGDYGQYQDAFWVSTDNLKQI